MSEDIKKTFYMKKILITGGSGSIGSQLVRKLLEYDPGIIRILSNDENGLFLLEHELKGYSNLRFLLGDIRDKSRLRRALEDIDIVLHAAALKHVPLCEYNPFEAIKTNIIGTQNLLEAAIDADVEKVITISTDKAVNPVNVLGATKLLAERLTIAANYYKGSKRTVASCVRFGNVLGSRGSVVELFIKQIQKGGPVTLTHPNMVRFAMSLDKAIELVLRATQIAKGEEIFIFKMNSIYIKDLAEVMIERLAPKYGYEPSDIEIKVIGKRKGEKMYEELMTEDEAMNVYETKDMLIILPEHPITSINRDYEKSFLKKYTSMDVPRLTKKEIWFLIEELLKTYPSLMPLHK